MSGRPGAEACMILRLASLKPARKNQKKPDSAPKSPGQERRLKSCLTFRSQSNSIIHTAPVVTSRNHAVADMELTSKCIRGIFFAAHWDEWIRRLSNYTFLIPRNFLTFLKWFKERFPDAVRVWQTCPNSHKTGPA